MQALRKKRKRKKLRGENPNDEKIHARRTSSRRTKST